MIKFFESFGLLVKPLRDSFTGIAYSSKVIRKINVSDNCFKNSKNKYSVAHFDDFVRDAMLKHDFRLPNNIEPNNYTPSSMKIGELSHRIFSFIFVKIFKHSSATV